MYESDITAVANTAQKKAEFMKKNPLGFFIMSMMAGLYIGVGSVFMGVVGGVFSGGGAYSTKLAAGTVFAVGLTLVVICGAELFTGNNFVMATGSMTGYVSWADTIKFWIICYIGNFAGSIIMAILFTMTGIPAGGDIGSYMSGLGVAKMNGTPMNLFGKAILCNICVCLVIWGCSRLKSEGAKIALCFCGVSAFVTCGFEHSIANMTFLTIALMNPNGAVLTIGGLCYNLLIVTIGNMIGGIIFVALPYVLTSRVKNR